MLEKKLLTNTSDFCLIPITILPPLSSFGFYLRINIIFIFSCLWEGFQSILNSKINMVLVFPSPELLMPCRRTRGFMAGIIKGGQRDLCSSIFLLSLLCVTFYHPFELIIGVSW